MIVKIITITIKWQNKFDINVIFQNNSDANNKIWPDSKGNVKERRVTKSGLLCGLQQRLVPRSHHPVWVQE